MIDDDGNRYYVYKIYRIVNRKNDNGSYSIYQDKEVCKAIGYKNEAGNITILPFGRELLYWNDQDYQHLYGQLDYIIACKPEEVFEYVDVLGEKADEIRLSKSEILELSRILYEKELNKKISYRKDEKPTTESILSSPVVAKILPIRYGNYKPYEAFYRICSYKVGYTAGSLNVCTTLDNNDIQMHTTTLDRETEVVKYITPLEYMIDDIKEEYTREELKRIENKLNEDLKIELKNEKEKEVSALEEQLRNERAAKKKEAEEKKRKEEEERKRKEEEQKKEEERKKAEEEYRKLQEEAERLKKEKIDKIVSAPKRALNKFNKKRDDQVKKQYETFKKIAGDNPSKIVTLEDGLEANKKLKDGKKELENEISEIRKLVLDNFERLLQLGDEIDKIDHKKIRVRIPERELIVNNDGRREINPIYSRYLDFIDFSFISDDNLKVSGIDWSRTNIQIDPQKVFNKDLSGCRFSDANIVWKKFDGCNLQNCYIGDEVESKGYKDILVDENTTLPKNAQESVKGL